jgi:hypothetical protein
LNQLGCDINAFAVEQKKNIFIYYILEAQLVSVKMCISMTIFKVAREGHFDDLWTKGVPNYPQQMLIG